MRDIRQPVRVEAARGQPTALWWSRRRLPLRVLDTWQYGGRWWQGEAGRVCFLVQGGALTAELHCLAAGESGTLSEKGVSQWWLMRLQD